MNKRGQIAIVMLFVVALALVVSALMVFVSFNSSFDDQSLKNSRLVLSVNLGEQYCIESVADATENTIIGLEEGENIKERFKSLLIEKDIGLEETGNFFRKAREGNFKFDKLSEDSYHFEMNGVIADAKGTESNVLRQFNICMDFDKNGKLIKRC